MNKCYFILYNSTKIYKGTILCNKAKKIGNTVNYNYIMNLKFDDEFKLYENIYITTDYTLKIFEYNGGKIITPNYFHFDIINQKIDKNTQNIIPSSLTNNCIFNTTTTYLLNNKIITPTSAPLQEPPIENNEYYLNFINSNNTTYNNQEKYYLSYNNSEKYKISTDTTTYNNIINNNIDLNNNTLFRYDNLNVFSIINNDSGRNLNNKLFTRFNNESNYIDISNTNVKQINTINEFEIIPKLYRTIVLSGIQYYSMKLNVNSIDDITLILKPYHSYTFKIHNTFLLKDENKYFKILSTNLSIVNIDDSKILTTPNISEQNILTINIPYISDLYDSNNKLYFKFECEFAEQDNLTNKIKQGYFTRTNTDGNAFKSDTDKFVELYTYFSR